MPRRRRRKKSTDSRKPPLMFTESPVNITHQLPSPVFCSDHPATATVVPVDGNSSVPWVSPHFEGVPSSTRRTRRRRNPSGSKVQSLHIDKKSSVSSCVANLLKSNKARYTSLKFIGEDVQTDSPSSEDDSVHFEIEGHLSMEGNESPLLPDGPVSAIGGLQSHGSNTAGHKGNADGKSNSGNRPQEFTNSPNVETWHASSGVSCIGDVEGAFDLSSVPRARSRVDSSSTPVASSEIQTPSIGDNANEMHSTEAVNRLQDESPVTGQSCVGDIAPARNTQLRPGRKQKQARQLFACGGPMENDGKSHDSGERGDFNMTSYQGSVENGMTSLHIKQEVLDSGDGGGWHHEGACCSVPLCEKNINLAAQAMHDSPFCGRQRTPAHVKALKITGTPVSRARGERSKILACDTPVEDYGLPVRLRRLKKFKKVKKEITRT